MALIYSGASPSCMSVAGRSLVHVALAQDTVHVEMVNMLLENGVSAIDVDGSGMNAGDILNGRDDADAIFSAAQQHSLGAVLSLRREAAPSVDGTASEAAAAEGTGTSTDDGATAAAETLYVAKHNFAAEKDQQISLKKKGPERVRVLEKTDTGWWRGELVDGYGASFLICIYWAWDGVP